jgi:hypothetical protein
MSNKDSSKKQLQEVVDKRNADTKKADLWYNVEQMHRSLTKSYKYLNSTAPKFSGGHVATSAVLERLTRLLCEASLEQTGKDKSGLEPVNRQTVKKAILLNDDLKVYFTPVLWRYNKNSTHYWESLPFEKKDFDTVVNKYFPNLQLTSKAELFLGHCLLNVYEDLVATSLTLLQYANKKSVTPSTVSTVVTLRFPSNLAALLNKEAERACKALGDSINKIVDEDGKEVKEASVEQPSEPKSNSKNASKSKGKGKEVEKSVESDSSESSEDNSSEDDDEEEEEAAPVVEPPSKKKNLKKSNDK